MKFTEKHLKKIIQEELEAVISEAEGSNEENFVATYRAHLMNQGEEDVAIAEQAARKALEVLKITGSSIENAIATIGQNVQDDFDSRVSPSKKPSSRSWHGDDGQANLPHQSTWED
tara:strand:- start:1060 stop:1407 length:348 start_codon:yes stop_codon:yes gene_type:complete